MPEPLNGTIRVGVLCEESGLSEWQLDCLRQVANLSFVEVALFIENAHQPSRRLTIPARLARVLRSGLLIWRLFERFVVSKRSNAGRGTQLPDDLQQVQKIRCSPLPVGKFRQTLTDEDLEAIASYNLDVVVRFGFGILSGRALNLARFGIWSYHHGDPERFRGAPPGFWEIHQGSSVTGVILQQLTEKLDGGVVLDRAYFKTNAASYTRQLDHVLFGSTPMLARALVALKNDAQFVAKRSPLTSSGPIFRYPKNGDMVRFLVRSAQAWVREQVSSLFRHQQWSIGLVDSSPAMVVSAALGRDFPVEGVNWLPEPAGSFLADPFLLSSGSEPMAIAEEFDWKSGKGHLSTIAIKDLEKSVRKSLDLPEHLSYPFIFEHEGVSYCLPECSESRTTMLYTCGAKGSLKPFATVMPGLAAVDPTLLFREGIWWLFCTLAGQNDNDTLYAFYTSELGSSWSPHALNPIKIDVRSSRPAGPFIVHGQAVIRPAQDSSTGYGRAIALNEVLELTPTTYSEKLVGRLVPAHDGPYRHGLHTISGDANLSVIDGARLTFVPKQAWRAFKQKIGQSKK